MAWLNFPAVELGFSLIFLWIIYRFLTASKRNKGKLGLPPGPRPWPLVGNLHLLGTFPPKSVTQLGKKYGPIMFLRLGSVPTVVASSPAMAKEFLKTHDLIFASRPATSGAKYLGYERRDVALAPYGEYWRQMRKLCTMELLTTKRTESFRWVREEEATAMVRSVWEGSEKGMRSVELRNLISTLSLNTICRMFAGRRYSELSGGDSFLEIMTEIMHLLGVIIVGDYIPSLSFLDLQGYRRRMKAVHKAYDAFAEKLIDERVELRRRRSKRSDNPDLLDVMLDMGESESSEIQDMLLAGVDTSLITIEWAMTELLRNPKVMARAQQEIELQVGRDRIVRESDLVNLDYLRCVMKETFRLHPVGAFMVPHESTEGCNVGGYYVPPKTRLLVNVWAMGRDDCIWKDPLEFKPERFIGSSIDLKGQHFELLPFGAGRRGCPGMSMGSSVVHLAVAQLIHCFDWSVEGEVNREEEFGLSLPKKFPLSALPSWRLATEGPP
ncbi:cytochrome P450 71AU50-like [Cryptomeria japonica]|uniref:cytochrome P450 71AU50-like n=1 Tax=Cryptomeria japonica TaxID=3369 RepID=UPI0027DA3582|nr:cytochrome P450 71AU50-like [Cryptomeria japonica]XP_059067774.1 cytochrome P450 71AU50-like [Cryptomeria japonica]XP_059067775.1 cytochrome P450 71AU50-like [Cryptomeria japonica]XP_059067777.1 cytochrome P450 71AU50-like [Cryptomeria japonica]